MDQSEILARLKSLLPAGWFPAAGSTSGTAASPTPILDAILSGIASVAAWAYSLLQYARNQTRLSSSSEGWLDLAALDYFGEGKFPRVAGESDAHYRARLQQWLLPRANTRQALSDAIEAVTGVTPRIVEPWNPGDTGCINGVWTPTWDAGFTWDQPGLTWDSTELKGAIFIGVDTLQSPGRMTNPGRAYQGYVDTILPMPALLNGNPVPCIGANLYMNAPGSSMFDFDGTVPLGAQEVYDAINRTKTHGVVVWVRFVPVAGGYLTTDTGSILTDDGGGRITL